MTLLKLLSWIRLGIVCHKEALVNCSLRLFPARLASHILWYSVSFFFLLSRREKTVSAVICFFSAFKLFGDVLADFVVLGQLFPLFGCTFQAFVRSLEGKLTVPPDRLTDWLTILIRCCCRFLWDFAFFYCFCAYIFYADNIVIIDTLVLSPTYVLRLRVREPSSVFRYLNIYVAPFQDLV